MLRSQPYPWHLLNIGDGAFTHAKRTKKIETVFWVNKFHHYFTKKRTTTGALLRNTRRILGKGERERAKKKGKMKVKRSDEKKRPHAFKEFKQSIFFNSKKNNQSNRNVNRLDRCLSVDISMRFAKKVSIILRSEMCVRVFFCLFLWVQMDCWTFFLVIKSVHFVY